MRVKELVAVSDIWRLAADDPSTKLISLTLDPASASFAGMHCEGIAGKRNGLPILVDAERLRGALALFDLDADISAELKGSDFVLRTKGRAIALRVAMEDAGRDAKIAKPSQQAVSTTMLADALAFLSDCVATGAGRPILTGVRIAHDKRGALILAATDGEAHTGLVRVKAKAPERRIDDQVVVPVKEIREFLSLADESETVRVDFSPSSAVLAFIGASMRVAALTSSQQFPDLNVLKTPSAYAHKIEVGPAELASAVKASVLLDADRIVRLAIRKGRAALIVRGQETGSFRALLPGGADAGAKSADAELAFDAHWLTPIEHLGEKATLYYENERTSVLFVGENGYRLWMALVMAS